MAHVNVTINGRSYQLACDDGQEAHLTRLARYMDKRAQELTAAVGHVNESLLLVMTGLVMADELSDVYGELEALRGGRGGSEAASGARARAEETVAARLDAVSGRIEAIAERLEDS